MTCRDDDGNTSLFALHGQEERGVGSCFPTKFGRGRRRSCSLVCDSDVAAAPPSSTLSTLTLPLLCTKSPNIGLNFGRTSMPNDN